MVDFVFNYCPSCGASLQSRQLFGKLLPYCEQCQQPYFKDPKVAAAVVVVDQHQVLLVQRKNPPFQGCWTLPAGFVDGGEDPRKAAQRECQEESGLIVEVGDLFDIHYGKDHQRGADLVLFYRAKLVGGNLAPGDDACGADWFSPDRLPQLAFRSTQHILKQLYKSP